jgi:hypothetical protein
LKTGSSILLALGLAIYMFSFSNAFVLDDENQIVGNALITSPGNIAVFFSGSTMTTSSNALGGSYYKPLMTLAYSVLWWLAPGQSFPYHLFQFLIVVLNSILAFMFLRGFLPSLLAWFLAAIYLAHPINSEVVLYIADLQDALYTCFGLAALNLIASTERLSSRAAAGLAALLMMSMLSKESGALYVMICAVYAAAFRPRSLWPAATAVAVVVAAYLAIRLGHAQLAPLAYPMNKIGRASLGSRLLTAPLDLYLYFFKFAVPYAFTTTQDWIVDDFDFSRFWLPLVFLAVLLGLSVGQSLRRLREGDRRFAFFTFWVFAGMGFHSHIIVPLDGTFADRWFYFPCLGLLAMIGLVVEEHLDFAIKISRPVAACGLALVAILSTRSLARSQNWQNNFVLCAHDVQLLPESYDLHNNLGVELFRRGRISEARDEFQRSTELLPIWDINWSNLGAAYSRLGDLKKAEEYYLRSMSNGNYFMAYENYAGMLVAEGRVGEARQFIEQKALPRFPASATLNKLYQVIKSK